MASPEVERPITSPSHGGGYPRPPSSSSAGSGEKRKIVGVRSHFQHHGKSSNNSQHKNKAAPINPMASSRRSSGTCRPSDRSGSNIPMRKRSYSFSEGHHKSVQSVTPSKRWKNHRRGSNKNDAKKFLLGGNIRDPLNLNSLADEKVAKVVNAVTPESSPIPTPKHRKAEYKIAVFIPPNISDPLNLMQNDNDDEYDASFCSANSKKKPRYRKRTRKHGHESVDTSTNESRNNDSRDDADNSEVESPEAKKSRTDRLSSGDTATPAATKSSKRPSMGDKKSVTFDEKSSKESASADKRPDSSSRSKAKKTFEFGNYNRYYGYRNEGHDPRLEHFRPEWFHGKDVLDIGCNAGQITMAIAKDMCPNNVLGIDIDDALISNARKNLNQYASRRVPSAMATPNPGFDAASAKNSEQLFPNSLPIMFGPLDPTQPDEEQPPPPAETTVESLPLLGGVTNAFPHNIKFLCDNYVLENDDLLDFAQAEFDTILCLSTTKWIHLNFGDDGLKRAFRRMFVQLRPGGILVLEPQGMASYAKKAKKLTARVRRNYANMKFKPDMFVDFLLNEVGFSGGDVVAVPEHSAAGFRRPIHVFKKQ